MIISPVCGCDGRTYDNKCLAYAAGANVAKNYACGEEANPQGCCAHVPEVCPSYISEVCGCDGKTYQNSCLAHADGVNVEKNEACEADSKLGKLCFFKDMDFCGNGLFCKTEDYYCKYESNPSGACTALPQESTCPMNFEPVCGCDCKTYSNKCEAYASGVNIFANSACPTFGCTFPNDEES